MNWLSQNWILVVLGIGVLLLLLRRASSAGHGQHGVRDDAPANVGEGGADAARSRKHGGHGGHGCC